MATRSSISVPVGGKVHTVYCHYDGYPTHMGKVLEEHFNSYEEALELVSGYAIRAIDTNGGIEYLTDQTPSVHDDWGRAIYEAGQAYDYLFTDDGWIVSYVGYDKPLSVKEAIAWQQKFSS